MPSCRGVLSDVIAPICTQCTLGDEELKCSAEIRFPLRQDFSPLRKRLYALREPPSSDGKPPGEKKRKGNLLKKAYGRTNPSLKGWWWSHGDGGGRQSCSGWIT